ncbi:MAG: S8 family peptidase [Gemmatimonadetes bacterium]|nr:S8 family peptidase [Gemmatimonadota bacterium]
MTPSMVLVKVNANLQLLNELLKLDLVSLVDLPPIPPPEDSYDFLQRIQIPDQLHHVPSDGPSACIVDSGVLAGHPLLNGTVVEEYDFDSGENTAVDLNGHGTQVGGLVVYGDIARRIPGNEWFPEVSLYSAKVLRNKVDPIDSTAPEAVFHDEERVEDQLRRAIVYFNQERGCRVFNLSIGHNDRLYTGGRQLPWAELLDELARTLDIVIIVAAGNVHDPEIPLGSNSSQFQSRVLDSLNTSKHKLIDPATSALSITVGAIARRDDPRMISHNTQLSATARGCPSAFTRCGPGVAGSVKPELVAPGGNFALELIAGRLTWRRNDVNLGEPTLNRSYLSGQTLRAVCGTSYSAAAVTHTAAQMEAALRNEFDVEPSQNLVRALLVSSANVDENAKRLVNGSQDQLLNLFGYGQPDVGYCWSSGNRVCIITEDSVEYRKFHVYSVVVPESFLSEKGKRSISVTLAYDPPTRLSRQDYISTAMWLEIFGGLTTEQIVEYRSKYDGEGDPPTVPDRNKLKFKPGGRTIRMSTVQKRTWRSNQGTMFLNRPDPSGDASLHVFVGCQPKYPNPYGSDSQRYALVITLQHDSQNIDIYQEVKTNIRTRTRIRTAV